jgi:hypothetical protein
MNTQINLKELVSNNNMAELTHAIAGILYYEVNTTDGNKYQFTVDMNNKDDVGTATFPAKIKAITLMRYIRQALENNSLIQIK